MTHPIEQQVRTTGGDGTQAAVITCADVRPLRDALGDDAAASELPLEIAAPIGALCDRARGAGLRIEEVLVQVKRAWRELPGMPRYEALTHRDARLDRIVTSVIRRYYDHAGRRSA